MSYRILSRTGILAWLVVAGFGIVACERKADTTSTNGSSSSTPRAADNTARNKADQSTQTKTPMDQSNSDASIKITAEIRRAIMDEKGMSMNAQNCKIITDAAGVVTLRGPVASQAEKDTIEAKAKSVGGVISVVNELEVKQI